MIGNESLSLSLSLSPPLSLLAAVFNFEGQNEHHLSLRVGDLLYLMEEYPGWYRGHLYQNSAVKVRLN